MSSEQDPTIYICVSISVLILIFIFISTAYPEYFPVFFIYSVIFVTFVAILCYIATEEKKSKVKEEAHMRSRGLVKYKGKWGTPEQVFEWQQLDKGLVKYLNKWITPEEMRRIKEEIERERRERELFESEQRRKGLVKFIDRFGQEHWDTPERIEILRQKDFEEQQKAKGLVKYHGEWVTPEEKFEKEQLAKGLCKYVDRHRRTRWGTPEQVEKWRQRDFEEEQRAKGLVKYKGKWVSKDEMERLQFESKAAEALAKEIAIYVRENSMGILLNTRVFNELITRFWMEKYRSALSSRFWDRVIASKMREAEGAALSEYIDLLTEELTEWAQNRNLTRLTRADTKLFLANNKIRLSTSLEQMLYREAKLKYRWLPPWMRE